MNELGYTSHARHRPSDILEGMWVEPLLLQGRFIDLEPISERHREGLEPYALDEDLLYMSDWQPLSLRPFEESFAASLHAKDRVPLVAVLKESRQPVASSSFMDIREPHRSLEVGHTWVTRPFQQTFVNPEMKLLMLQHAFEVLGCVRVQLKGDNRNEQSKAAMRKLGAKEEGVLRRHLMCRDGFIRDSIYFSILDSEWPDVKARLTARLDRMAG